MDAHGSQLLRNIARAPQLALVLDLDGTLIPFAATPEEAVVDAPTRELLAQLARAPGVTVAVVSGRKREQLEERVGDIEGLCLSAEHGAWRRDEHGWAQVQLYGADPAPVEAALRELARAHPGALVERKTWSVTLHFRRVPSARREALIVEASDAIERWACEHPEYELLEGELVLEVRHRGAHKGRAVEWLRERVPADTSFVAIGDDRTDEDTFAALGEGDLSVLVGRAARPTRARARLDDVPAVLSFLRSLLRTREANDPTDEHALPRPLSRVPPGSGGAPLVVVSNRLPDAPARAAGESERARNVGGLVSGLAPALSARGGVWLGWSGGRHADTLDLAIDRSVTPTLASFDFRPEWHSRFYNGFANRSLWPIFHGMPSRARYDESEWSAYVEVNDVFAEQASKLVAPDGTVWAHDYHLLCFGDALRRRGHRGPIGLFVHVPFPPIELFETIPWARELMEAMLAFDLVGFHTRRYVASFVRCAEELVSGAAATDRGVRVAGRDVRVGAFPLGIDTAPFEDPDDDEREVAELQATLQGRSLVLGVDRLDYSKGIVERLLAFARMLELRPDWRGRVAMLQIAVPSRADVPEYAEQRRTIETLVGRINGEYGEAHWMPVRYVHRSYGRGQLAALYRAADVGFVTPLRDGMNLVAKEYVAAQDPRSPGVLVLSRFAGAADELEQAVLTNPHHREGMARDLVRALEMPLEERIARHAPMLERVRRSTPEAWADSFLRELEAGHR